VNVGSPQNPVYLPPQVCVVVAGQSSRAKLSPSQTQQMIRFAVRRPVHNAESIVTGGARLLGFEPPNSTLVRSLLQHRLGTGFNMTRIHSQPRSYRSSLPYPVVSLPAQLYDTMERKSPKPDPAAGTWRTYNLRQKQAYLPGHSSGYHAQEYKIHGQIHSR
jgi:hypothetical protein